MKYHQRDIAEINFLFPDGVCKPHPALIVSNDQLQEDEGFMYFALISSKDYNPQYCYELKDGMMTKPLSKVSYVKCQLLVGDVERDVLSKIGVLKQPYFNEVVEKIKTSIF